MRRLIVGQMHLDAPLTFERGMALQRSLHEHVVQGGHAQLLFLTHSPVITLGRRMAKVASVGEGEIPIVHTQRGGQATYHGPGQLVVYAHCPLVRWGVSPRVFMDVFQEVLVSVLARQCGVPASVLPGVTGVVAGENQIKVASLGVHVSHKVTLHGAALNVDRRVLPAFSTFQPCDGDLEMGCLEDFMDSVPGLEVLAEWILGEFRERVK